jgi:RimJ/RimL family protein N-acetyltransferase
MTAKASAVRLEAFTVSGITRLMEWVDSPEALILWAGPSLFRWPLDAVQLTNYARSAHDGARLIWAAVDNTDGEVVGHCEVTLDRGNRCGHVMRVLVAPHRRGAGVATAMMRDLVRVAFDELGLHRLFLSVYDFNAPAVACYERVGFVREGHIREETKAPSGYWSTLVMGLLETDPRPEPQ